MQERTRELRGMHADLMSMEPIDSGLCRLTVWPEEHGMHARERKTVRLIAQQGWSYRRFRDTRPPPTLARAFPPPTLRLTSGRQGFRHSEHSSNISLQ